MRRLNNATGYVLMHFKREDESEEVSNVIGKPRGEWLCEEPLIIYTTIQDLIDATPGFDKKKNIIGYVVAHLLGERVEIVSIP